MLTAAEAICEAASRRSMRFVATKSVAQQDIQSLHRVRKRLVHNRTALTNEIRSILGEFGSVFSQGHRPLEEESKVFSTEKKILLTTGRNQTHNSI